MASQSAIKTEPLKAGQGAPKKLLGWLNSLLIDLRAIEPKQGSGVTLRRFNDGTEINAKGGGASGGAGGTLPAYPAEDGTYVLGVVIASGVPTLQWLPTGVC